MELENKIILSDIADDCLFRILSNLSFQELGILRTLNKRFYQFINQSEFWKIYYLYNKNSFQINYLNLSSLEVLNYYKILHILEQNYQREIRLESLWSSSQDNQQNIFETLNDDESLFWSSTGTQGVDDRDEFLIYKVDSGLGYITSFQIKFFYAYYLLNKLYPARRIKFEAGLSSLELTYSQQFNCDLEYQQGVEEYIATFRLQRPILASFIKITLSGRVGCQETDNQYYFAVERFKVLGVQISNLESKDDLVDLDNYLNEKLEIHSEKDKIEKKEQVEKLQQKICNLTRKVGQLESQSQSVNFSTLFDKRQAQIQESKHFIETQDANLFNSIYELRGNYVAYEFIMKDPLLMQKYLQVCAQNKYQLSELESLVIIMQKINFNLLAKVVVVMIEFYQESYTFSDALKTENFTKKFLGLIQSTIELNYLPYEQSLSTIEYFSYSDYYYCLFIEKLKDYLEIPEELMKMAYEQCKFEKKYRKSDVLQAVPRRQLFNYIQFKLLPIFYFLSFKVFIKNTQMPITVKKDLFSQQGSQQEKQQLNQPNVEMEQNENKQMKILRLMVEEKFSSQEQAKKFDEEMKNQAQAFIQAKNIDLINQQQALRQNYYVFEALINSPDQLSQYFHSKINNQQHDLNGLESICLFVPQINYTLIIKILNLAFDLVNQSYQQKSTADDIKKQKEKVYENLEGLFGDSLKLNSQENQTKYSSFKFTKSTAAFYFIVKPLQNYLNLSNEEVETIVQLLNQNLLYGLQAEPITLNFSQYKTFIEEYLMCRSILVIFKYFLEKYDGTPSIICV